MGNIEINKLQEELNELRQEVNDLKTELKPRKLQSLGEFLTEYVILDPNGKLNVTEFNPQCLA